MEPLPLCLTRRTITCVLILGMACTHAPASTTDLRHPPSARGFDAVVQVGLTRVRETTRQYVSLDSAVAAGYAREVTQCYVDPHHGAMGYHHINRALVDAEVQVDRPEILLYERHRDGQYTLNGVEFIVPYQRWPRDSVPPTVMGQNLKQSDPLKIWYLHMWAWRENSAGLFADWNPAVQCLADSTALPVR